jgi:competence protein ComEA
MLLLQEIFMKKFILSLISVGLLFGTASYARNKDFSAEQSFTSKHAAQVVLEKAKKSKRKTAKRKTAKRKSQQSRQRAKRKVNLNIAEAKDLQGVIKGLGKKRAMNIVAYRKQHGLFNEVTDIAKVKGFSKRYVDKNRQLLRKKFTV